MRRADWPTERPIFLQRTEVRSAWRIRTLQPDTYGLQGEAFLSESLEPIVPEYEQVGAPPGVSRQATVSQAVESPYHASTCAENAAFREVRRPYYARDCAVATAFQQVKQPDYASNCAQLEYHHVIDDEAPVHTEAFDSSSSSADRSGSEDDSTRVARRPFLLKDKAHARESSEGSESTRREDSQESTEREESQESSDDEESERLSRHNAPICYSRARRLSVSEESSGEEDGEEYAPHTTRHYGHRDPSPSGVDESYYLGEEGEEYSFESTPRALSRAAPRYHSRALHSHPWRASTPPSIRSSTSAPSIASVSESEDWIVSPESVHENDSYQSQPQGAWDFSSEDEAPAPYAQHHALPAARPQLYLPAPELSISARDFFGFDTACSSPKIPVAARSTQRANAPASPRLPPRRSPPQQAPRREAGPGRRRQLLNSVRSAFGSAGEATSSAARPSVRKPLMIGGSSSNASARKALQLPSSAVSKAIAAPAAVKLLTQGESNEERALVHVPRT